MSLNQEAQGQEPNQPKKGRRAKPITSISGIIAHRIVPPMPAGRCISHSADRVIKEQPFVEDSSPKPKANKRQIDLGIESRKAILAAIKAGHDDTLKIMAHTKLSKSAVFGYWTQLANKGLITVDRTKKPFRFEVAK